ncbi:DUF2029 domain-containing protein [Candidatus Sumerlaeota bacterium]|nr:DUF2029 domain-containing protein [Candidatus Sumerlaeota bacterium]
MTRWFAALKPDSIWDWIAAAACIPLLAWLVYAQALLPNSPEHKIDWPWAQRDHAPHVTIHNNDFKHFFLGAVLLKRGGNPYHYENLQQARRDFGIDSGINPFVYPPFNGIAMWWLTPSDVKPPSFRQFSDAATLWNRMQYVLLALSAACILLLIGDEKFWLKLAALLGVLAFSWPLTRTITAGQVNMVLLAVYCAAPLLLRWRLIPGAGILAAFGAWYKLAPGALLFYFCARRRWWSAIWFVGAAIVIVLLALLLVGARVHLDYWPLLRDMGYGKSTWAEHSMEYHLEASNQSINSFLLHAFSENAVKNPANKTTPWVNLGAGAANGLTYAVALALLAGMAWLTWRLSKVREDDAGAPYDAPERLAYSLWIFVSLLIPSLMWDHYCLLLLPAQMFMLDAILRMERRGAAFGFSIAAWLIAAILIDWKFPFAVASWNPRFQAADLDWLARIGITDYRSGVGIIVEKHKLFGTLLLLALNATLLAPTLKRSTHKA